MVILVSIAILHAMHCIEYGKDSKFTFFYIHHNISICLYDEKFFLVEVAINKNARYIMSRA